MRMDLEKAMQSLLRHQARADARFEAKFDRADARFRHAEARLDRLERVVALNNRVVTRLVRYGVSLRSDLRRLAQAQAATDRALKTFIASRTQRNGAR